MLAYTFGLRHALDADHISVGYSRRSRRFLTPDNDLGYRSHDAASGRIRSAASYCRNMVFIGPLYVSGNSTPFSHISLTYTLHIVS